MYRDEYGVDVATIDGGGAAGGLAGALAALGGRLVPGFELVADQLDLDDRLAGADVVVTGEGYLDEQSFEGKVVGGVAASRPRPTRPVLAIVGDADDDARRAHPDDHPRRTVRLERAEREPLWCIEQTRAAADRPVAGRRGDDADRRLSRQSDRPARSGCGGRARGVAGHRR